MESQVQPDINVEEEFEKLCGETLPDLKRATENKSIANKKEDRVNYSDPLHIDVSLIPEGEEWAWVRYFHDSAHTKPSDIDIHNLMDKATKGYFPVSSDEFPQLLTEQRKIYSGNGYIMYKGSLLCRRLKQKQLEYSAQNAMMEVANRYIEDLKIAAGPELENDIIGFVDIG